MKRLYFLRLAAALTALLLLLSLGLTACAEPPVDAPADNPPADNPPADNPPADNPPADNPPADNPPADNPPEDNPPEDAPADGDILTADLNNDGTPDRIRITLTDESATSATLCLLDGADGSEWMAETVSLSEGKKSGYCLKIGKNNNRDELVFWEYLLLSDGTLFVRYEVYCFEGDERQRVDFSSYRFDLSSDAAIDSQGVVLERLLTDLNEHLRATFSHDAYLLLDSRTEVLRYSTAEKMLPSEELFFDLRDFLPAS